MSDVSCSRCGSTAAALERAPMPGAIGERILAQSCAACWQEWRETQVKLMNEGRLTPANPDHYKLLIEQMTAFLALRDDTSG